MKLVSRALHDLLECREETNHSTGEKTKRWISTISWNKPYAIQRNDRKIRMNDKKYPKGTFFEIVVNGQMPDFMRPKQIKQS